MTRRDYATRRQDRRWRIVLSLMSGLLTLAGLLALSLGSVKAAGGGGETATTEKVWSKNSQQIAVPTIYQTECQECHGKDASGSGPMHTQFIPEPANLTLVHDSPAMLTSIVKNGIQGTQMEAHPNLTDAQIQEIATFVGNVRMNSQRQWDWTYAVADNPTLPAPNMGKAIYVTSCAECHGDNGDGQSDDLQDNHIWPKPANFRARNSELGRVYYIVNYGRPGTMMPPMEPKIQSAQGRWAVAQYVNGLWDPKSTATIPTGTKEEYTNPYTPTDMAVVSRGQQLATLNCTYCHMGDMAGGWMAPDLTDRKWRFGGGRDNAVFQVVKEGVPGMLMPPNENLPVNDRWAIITYVRHQGGLPEPIIELMQAQGQGE